MLKFVLFDVRFGIAGSGIKCPNNFVLGGRAFLQFRI